MERRGFTLIELLVVIAIIAILASILFPVFAEAREKARQASCLSNTKQIGTAMEMYTQDYDEVFPSPWPLSGQGVFSWDHTFAEVVMPYIRSTGVFHCPSADPRTYVSSAGIAAAYLMNETGWSAEPRRSLYRPGLASARIVAPADYILMTEAMGIDDPEAYTWQDSQVGFTDETHAAWGGSPRPDLREELGWDRFYNVPGCDWGRVGVPLAMGRRHLGANACVFADGHAKSVTNTRGNNWLPDLPSPSF